MKVLFSTSETSKARTVLNSLPTNDIGESEFVDVQNIYLDYLADRANYSLSTANTSIIYNAGLRKHPLAGFARSVYHTITGQKIPVTLTHMNGNTQLRVKDIVKPDISIFPNPAENGVFNIELENYKEDDDIECKVFNINGQNILSQKIKQKSTQIVMQNQNSGMYFVQILVNKIKVSTEKLVVN